MKSKHNQKYLLWQKILLKILLIMVVGIVVYSPFHEFWHIVGVTLIDHRWSYNGRLFLPVISCVDCQTASLLEMVFITGLPYLLDLLLLLAALFFLSRFWNYLAALAVFDLLSNLVGALLVAFFNVSISNDFINLIILGQSWLVAVILVLGFLLFFKKFKASKSFL